MADNIPVRRVVTGEDDRGRSLVRWDGAAPNVHEASSGPGRNHVDIWAWDGPQLPLSEDRDDGNMPYDFPGAPNGGHFRIVQTLPKPEGYDPATDPDVIPEHEPEERPLGRAWDRGGKNFFTSQMHITESIDYGIVLSGERVMETDDATVLMKPGDVVIQLGAWHRWSSPRIGCQMAFDMIGARIDPAALRPQISAPPLVRNDPTAPDDRPADFARRIVAVNVDEKTSRLVSDGPATDITVDPARPGYRSAHLWTTDSTPASLSILSAQKPGGIVPPAAGTICRIVTVPPDSAWRGSVGAAEVAAYFASVGAPEASTYSTSSADPYMQRTETLDFAMVLAGTPTLVLDTDTVQLAPGEVAVIRGNNHAFANHGTEPAVIAITSHDGRR